MQEITVKQLLKILPIDENIRSLVLSKFDVLEDDQRLEIRKICWLMFYQVYNDKVKLELDKTILSSSNKQADLKGNLYQELEEKVFKELRVKIVQIGEEEGVWNIRTKLQQLLSRRLTG